MRTIIIGRRKGRPANGLLGSMKICPSLSSPVKSLQSLIFPFPWWPISSWPFLSFSFFSISFLFPWLLKFTLLSQFTASSWVGRNSLHNIPDSSSSAILLVNHHCLRKTQSKHVFSAWLYVRYWNTKAAEIHVLPSRKWQVHGNPSHSTWAAYLISFPSLLTCIRHPSRSHQSRIFHHQEHSLHLNYPTNSTQLSVKASSAVQSRPSPYPRRRTCSLGLDHFLDQLTLCLLPLLNHNLYSWYGPGRKKEYGDKTMAHRSKKLGIKMCCWV